MFRPDPDGFHSDAILLCDPSVYLQIFKHVFEYHSRQFLNDTVPAGTIQPVGISPASYPSVAVFRKTERTDSRTRIIAMVRVTADMGSLKKIE